VELLSKAVLQFRRMFKTGALDVDPFIYVTLPSLTMSISRGRFMPNATIVANDQYKKVSLVCREWLIHLNDKNLFTEYPLVIDTSKYMNSNTIAAELLDDLEPADEYIAFDNDDDDATSTAVPSDTTSVISGNTLSSSASSSTDARPSLTSSSSSSNNTPPPPRNYYNRPKTTFVPDAVNRREKYKGILWLLFSWMR